MNLTLLIIALIACIGIMILFFKKNEKSNQIIRELSEEKTKLQGEKNILTERLKSTERAYIESEQKCKSIDEAMKLQFKDLAQSILQEKSNSLKISSDETLRPLKEEIKNFREQIIKSYADETGQRKSLEDKIQELIQQSEKLGSEANNLTKALKGDSNVQGNWGEQILERILEESGLEKNIGYEVQSYIKDEGGAKVISDDNHKMRPDVIINFPDQRSIIIDSKVSITAYVGYMNAQEKKQKDEFLKQHIQSVKRHIVELANKDYSKYLKKKIDFVMLFIPNEGAYNLAMQNDAELWEEAYRKKIVIIGPTSLISTLKLVENLWDRDNQEKNILSIMEEVEKLYDKFRLFLESFDDANSQITKAQEKMTEAKNRLYDGRGNIISKFAKMKEMGLKTKNNLPPSYQKRLNDYIKEE
ncbi:DNA recombination protein RmuC [Falsiporphyromonas endometrii]|uniref:DNA recombination protein RmuC n=1 Tax=Falsiporphyromonas endometrii TaxID=1387297 RepID=A0ABV9K960_9PORP